jgi:hypothetical protein
MFCPNCGSNQNDDLKFCKACGVNLSAVRRAVAEPEAVERFDWSKTWLAEMMMSGEESVKRAAEIERLQGITPETKRRKEIKAGVITGSVGAALMITLFVLMNGIIAGGRVSEAAAEILSRIWIVGVIPLFVGTALIFNGIFVSKKGHGLNAGHETDDGIAKLPGASDPAFIGPAQTNQLGAVPFSVTDETTRHLEEPLSRKAKKPNH